MATKSTGTGSGRPWRDGELNRDELFHVLANRRRRYALHLLRREETIELGEAAEQIAAWENDKPVGEVSSTERKHVYTALQQSHLPKMDDLGIVEYDQRRGTIETTEAAGEFEIHLEITRGNAIPWSAYYLGMSVVAVALVVSIWLDAYPLTLLPDVAWAAAITTALTFSAAVHYYASRGMRLGAADTPLEVATERGVE